MTEEDILHTVVAFAAAAVRADATELHAAHGYILHEFLSPPDARWKNTSAVIASKQATWDRNQ
jgi:hypothetical protein